VTTGEPTSAKGPFDQGKLDALMDSAGLDLLLTTSKHNVQYLLGGYRYHFFVHQDAIGTSRYLPVVGYVKGAPERSFYIGNGYEWMHQQAIPALWVAEARNVTWSSQEAALEAANFTRARGLEQATIGVEMAFLPWDAGQALRQALPQANLLDATLTLEELRSVKRPDELEMMRLGAERTVESMLQIMDEAPPGTAKEDLLRSLRLAEIARDLDFDYGWITTGTAHNRMPWRGSWDQGDIMSIDSGANYRGYITDMTRMAVMGEPTVEQSRLLSEIDSVLMAARHEVRNGAIGDEMFVAAETARQECSAGKDIIFTAHGMGLTSNEAPRLTSTGVAKYAPSHRSQPLRSGMVLSIEAEVAGGLGYVKMEDTVVVTDGGWNAYGDFGRGWNRQH
jgi:Xaa-Pro aminopeptidase